MKLKKRGYNVNRCTSIAAPRFCPSSSVSQVLKQLPRDSLRIENDLDGIPFLPMWGSPVGDKLWFVSSGDGTHSAKFIPMSLIQHQEAEMNKNGNDDGKGGPTTTTTTEAATTITTVKSTSHEEEGTMKNAIRALEWVDSIWINSRLPETAGVITRTHRIPAYVSRVNELIQEME